MNILDQIVAHKRKEVALCKDVAPVSSLEQRPFFSRQTVSMKEAIRDRTKSGIIAEFKRRSPSKGVINGNVRPEVVTQGYARAGASAVSVLTDQDFFGGSTDDILRVRENNACPVLRKDFTVDEYQILEAKSQGADAILLIAAVLTPKESATFAALAHSLGLEVLLEVHNEAELLDNLGAGADLIGVNNRNLKDFSVSIEVSKKLSALIPDDVVRVSESGLSSVEAIVELKGCGYEGFLIGENFMKEPEPEKAAADFIAKLNALQQAAKQIPGR